MNSRELELKVFGSVEILVRKKRNVFYKTIGRKIEEELQAGGESSLQFEYTYENGYLKELKDPIQPIYAYFYDLSRLSQEDVNGWSRTYSYDLSGSLKSKSTPLSSAVTGYNVSCLLKNVHPTIIVAGSSFQEILE